MTASFDDKLMDDLGFPDLGEPEDEETEHASEPTTEDSEGAGDDEPEPEPLAAEPDGDSEPQRRGDPGEPEPEEEAEEEEDDVEALRARLAELETQNTGLRSAISDERNRVREWRERAGAAVQPVPTTPGTPAAVAQADPSGQPPAAVAGQPVPEEGAPPGVRVEVSPDGQLVYAREDGIEAIAERVIERKLTPSPEQQEVQAYQQVRSQVYGQIEQIPDEAERTSAVETAKQVLEAENWMVGQIQSLAGPNTTREQVPAAIDHFDLITKAGEKFPELAPYMQDLTVAWYTRNPLHEQSVINAVRRSRPPAAPPATPPATPPGAQRRIPKAMGRRTGSRSKTPQALEAEFQELDRELVSNPWGMAEDRYARWEELANKLGKEV